MSDLVFLVAGDPDQRTGGYLYDARMVAAWRVTGWVVEVIGLRGRFPIADDVARSAFEDALAAQATGTCVIIDGLVLGTLGALAARHAERLTLVALIHHPLADETGLDRTTAGHLRDAERDALAHVAHVVATSRFTAERLVTHYDVPSARLDVIEPGVDQPAAANHASAAPPLLLVVATLIPRKGHDVLIQALARIADRRWQCVLVGDTDRDPAHTEKIRAAIASHGLGDRITLVGSEAREALDPRYQSAYLFVLPSFYEGYGMVVDEALAHGLPVVTTTGGALAQTLPAGAGVAVAPGAVDELADALARLLDDPVERQRLAREAARVGAARASWQDAAQRFRAVLERIQPGRPT